MQPTDYKAFVSSTVKDLLPHRAHVIQELRRAGFHVDPMEEWPASADEPKKFSQERMDGCHLCVLLIARRRGYVPAGEELSITQLEYREALRLKIDVLPYILDDAETDWPAEFDVIAQAKTDDALAGERDKLAVWRAEVEGRHGRELFNKYPASIGIGAASSRWREENGFKVALRRYLQLVEHEHGFIRFVSLPRLEDISNAPIQRLYVEPAVAPRWVSPDVDPAEWPATQPLLDAVTEHKRLVLLGDPGSGKSTLVSWIAWQLARHHHDGTSIWTERLGRLVPLPMILRDLGIGPDVTWDKLLDAFTQQPMGKLLTLTNLKQLLRDGQAIIMLDGLDEIGIPDLRRDLRDAVKGMWEKDDACQWLLTSRIVGYDEVSFDEGETWEGSVGLRSGSFTPILAGRRYVTPFDDPRVEQFALNWNILREPSEAKARQAATGLLEAVRAVESTKKLGRIPFLLTMMSLIRRVRGVLPHGRALLYSEIAHAFLETVDSYRQIYARPETLPEKKRWLARVGFEMQQHRSKKKRVFDMATDYKMIAKLYRGENTDEIFANGTEVREWIAATMSESDPEGSRADAAEVLDHIVKRCGLLLPRGEDRFAFIHLSFQEYFAACFLQHQIASPFWLADFVERIAPGARKGDLKRFANDPIWCETLVFLVEMIAASEQPLWLEPLRECLFGSNFTEVVRFDPSERGQAVLLARLAIDPYSGLASADRQRAATICCRWEVESQKRFEDDEDQKRFEDRENQKRFECGDEPSFSGNEIARVLFTADPETRTLVTARLAAMAKAIGLKKLNLGGTQVSDVAPLAALANLHGLNLNNTRVSDVGPLVSLAKLRHLWLKGSKVSQKELAKLKAALPECGIHHD